MRTGPIRMPSALATTTTWSRRASTAPPGCPYCTRRISTWESVTNALRELPSPEHYSTPRHGSGVWAPSLRFHEGTYFIVYPDPDHGIYVLTAPDPRGEWSR